MPHRPMDAAAPTPAEPYTLTRIRVQGFKSLADVSVDIRPLTVFAGANSSGKSSVMQPLLLMKQTEEVPFRTDGLKLDGPLVYLNSAVDAIPVGRDGEGFVVRSTYNNGDEYIMEYRTSARGRFETSSMVIVRGDEYESFIVGGVADRFLTRRNRSGLDRDNKFGVVESFKSGVSVPVDFFELRNSIHVQESDTENVDPNQARFISFVPGLPLRSSAARMIYLPGLRGMPERAYPVTARFGDFEGSFSAYTASVLEEWQRTDSARVRAVRRAIKQIGLTRTVEAVLKGANEVEIKVGRLPANTRGKDTLVNIADVGLGMSQVLPIIVALIAAEPGQLVYIEQPELHLHPKAQRAMASVLADAAKRGVRVVIETHSAILLLAIQTLVAEGSLAPDLVALHWFSRDSKGFTKVTRAELDENGAFDADWPEDFSDTELAAQDAFLSAVERREASNGA